MFSGAMNYCASTLGHETGDEEDRETRREKQRTTCRRELHLAKSVFAAHFIPLFVMDSSASGHLLPWRTGNAIGVEIRSFKTESVATCVTPATGD
jgi:hypothetical protein